MNLIDNALLDRKIKTPYVDGLYAAVPYHIIRQIRMHHLNTPDDVVFAALDHIGIEAIVDIISQGAFLVDIAASLDVPVTKVDRWLHQDSTRWEAVGVAERYAAEHHLSLAIRTVMDVGKTDVDAMKVAKTKAEMQKWVATRKDRDKYGDKINHSHDGDVAVQFNITLGGNTPERKVIEM